MSKLLHGVRVLDLTQAYSGPFCAMHLADHGAEVIKVESLNGDQSRSWGPFKNGSSAYYAYINRNKKGISLNLREQDGKEILRDLIRQADVILENYRVGIFEEMGFGWEELKRLNPRIIYGSISGFGLDGEMARRPCYDIVAQAVSGMISVTGHSKESCVKIGPSIGDNYSGTYLALGVCMALYHREKTGCGTRLDVAMLDTLFSVMENFVVMYTVTGKIPEPMGNIDSGIAPFDSFRAKDGTFVMGCGTDKMWNNLCIAMGKPELVHDPRFITNEDRCQNYLPTLKEIIEDWSTHLSVDEIEKIITGQNIPFGKINNIRQICEHPQIGVRHMLWNVEDPGIGEIIQIPGTPIKVAGAEDKPACGAPLLGQDTERILRDLLGYPKEKIEKLAADRTIRLYRPQ